MFKSLRHSSFLAAAAIAIGLGSAPAMAYQPTMISAAPRQVKVGKRGLFGGVRASVGGYGRKGAGVSMAAQQRASRKQRNVARNRRGHR